MTEAITCIIPTYDRPEVLKETVNLLLYNLGFNGTIYVLIGNDGDELPDGLLFGYPGIRVLPGPKRGLGANLNMLLQAAETEVVLQMDDDHHLVKGIDINQFVEDLFDPKYGIGWIRLFLGTEKDLRNDDRFYKFEARMFERYWYPFPKVGELYIPSNRPHLKHKLFHDYFGMYQEDLKLGETETEFCHRYADKHHQGMPWVVIPVAAPSFDTWEHVGQSYQKRGY